MPRLACDNVIVCGALACERDTLLERAAELMGATSRAGRASSGTFSERSEAV